MKSIYLLCVQLTDVKKIYQKHFPSNNLPHGTPTFCVIFTLPNWICSILYSYGFSISSSSCKSTLSPTSQWHTADPPIGSASFPAHVLMPSVSSTRLLDLLQISYFSGQKPHCATNFSNGAESCRKLQKAAERCRRLENLSKTTRGRVFTGCI